MEDDDYCIVEYAQLDADGMRLSKEDCALARKAKEVACQRDQILQLLGEIKDSVGSFDEARLLYRNWRVRVLKSLRRQRIFDELPEFSGVCGSCRQDVGYYSVHAIVKSGSVEWICHSCDVMDNQDLADLRAAVDANLLKLRTSLNELAEVASLQQVQKLIRIRDVLKASAKAPGERYEVPRIGGHEFFEWKLLVIDPMPNFPKEELERREFCAMMSTKERADLTRLMKQVERLHQRYFHTDLLGLIADSVKTRNMHMQKRFETIRKPALFESLSPEAAKALWDAQKGKCSSCGDDMLWSRLFGGGWLCPELDRTDVRLGTYVDNCTWMCRCCNTFKGSTLDVRAYDRVHLDTLENVMGRLPEVSDESMKLLSAEVDRQGGRDAHLKWLREKSAPAPQPVAPLAPHLAPPPASGTTCATA